MPPQAKEAKGQMHMQNKFDADKTRAGDPGELFFAAHAARILDEAVIAVTPLEQKPHEEGDYLVTLEDGKQITVEVKTDASGRFPRTGNIAVQFFNDAMTRRGWISDIQDPAKRHVDVLAWIIYRDTQAKQPFAALTVAVKDFLQLFGCPPGGCDMCGRCPEPEDDGKSLADVFPQYWTFPREKPRIV